VKKIITFQRLLLNSTPRIERGFGRRIFILVIVVVYAAGSSLIGMSLFNIFFPVTSLAIVYLIINGNRKVFELVPVSSTYIVANVFLLSVVLTAICFLSLYLLLMAGVLLLILIVSIAAPSHISLTGGSNTLPVTPGEWKSVLFSLLLIMLILFVVTALSLAKSKTVRLAGISVFSACIYATLWLLKIQTPSVGTSDTVNVSFYIMPRFNTIPYANMILLLLGIACLIFVPASIYAGMRFYKCRFIDNKISLNN
jgi:hypothetical protein